MSSSGDSSHKSIDRSSDGSSDHVPDWDPDKAVFTFYDMFSSENATGGKGRKEGTPARGVLQPAADASTDANDDAGTGAAWKVSQEKQKTSKAAVEAWSVLEDTPLQKRKRVSFTELPDAQNRPLSTPSNTKSRNQQSENQQPENQQFESGPTPKPSQKKKRVSFAGISGFPKRPMTPSKTPSKKTPNKQKTKSTPRKKNPRTPTTVTTSATATPTVLTYPKLPPSPTYHSDLPKPAEPEPLDEDSFHDLTEENNLLRTRVQAFEKLDDTILAAAAPIGAIAFSEIADTQTIDPVRQTLRTVDRPAAEACLVLLDKLTETQAGLVASRTEGMEQFIKFEEADEEARRGKILVERIGLLEESNEVLGAEKDELTRLCLSKHLTAQERGQYIKTLVETNKRFKEIQISDKVTIARLQGEVNDLDRENRGLEQQKATFAKSAEVYIKNLCKEGAATTTTAEPGSTAESQSDAYDEETKKAAEGLAEVMNLLSGKNYVDAIIPDSPFVFLLDIVREYASNVRGGGQIPPVTAVTDSEPGSDSGSSVSSSISLTNIPDDDPCRKVKLLLKSRTVERDDLRRLNDISNMNIQQASIPYKAQAVELKKATEALGQCETKHTTTVAELKKLRKEMKELQQDNEVLVAAIDELKITKSTVADGEAQARLIRNMRLEINKAASENQHQGSKIEDLKKQNTDLKNTIGMHSIEIASKDDLIDKIREEFLKLGNNPADTKALKAEIASLRVTGDECEKSNKQLLEIQKLATDRIGALQVEVDRLAGVDDEAGNAKKQLSELQKKSAEQIGALQAEIKNLDPRKKNAPAIQAQMNILLEAERRLLALQTSRIDELRAVISIWESLNMSSEDLALEHLKQLRDTSSKKDDQITALQVEIEGLRNALPMRTTGGGPDPCAHIKKQLLDVQVNSIKKDTQINDLEAEINELKNALSAGTFKDGTDPCVWVKKQLSDVQAASAKKDALIKDLQVEIHKVNAGPKNRSGSDLQARNIIELQGRLNNVRRRLKIRKQAQDSLEERLARSKALSAAPSPKEFERRLKEITARQKQTYVKRINRLYRIKQQQMFPIVSKADRPGGFPETCLRDLLRQDGPPIKEISDRWFIMQWDELYDQIAILCQINYRARIDQLQYNYELSARGDQLLSFYLRDVVVSESAMHDRINSLTENFAYTYRAKIAIAVIFRILVEEIFDPIRYLLYMQFPDPTRWKTKLQFRQAFEQLDNPNFPRAETMRGFQERESWCTRQATLTDKEVYRPRKQRDTNFNYFKQIEERDYDGNIGGKTSPSVFSFSANRTY